LGFLRVVTIGAGGGVSGDGRESMLTLGTEEAVPCASVFLGADVGGRDFEETVWTVVAVQLAGDTLFASDGIAFLAEEQRGEWMVVDAEDG